MPKRKNFIAMMRVPGNYPNGQVQRDADDKIAISFRSGERWGWSTLYGLSTRDARLLAKRINQFIDNGG